VRNLHIFRNKRQTGFTLIELLVVIAIIGLLASVVLLSLNSAREKSRNAKRLADVRQIASALELYFNDCGGYPVQGTSNAPITLNDDVKLAQGVNAGVDQCDSDDDASAATEGGIHAVATATGQTYLGQFPTSPTPSDGTCSTAGGGGGDANPYLYYATTANTYTLTFCLGSATGGYDAGLKTLTPSGIN
jgi:prepilin-type N-terminal cleavage/methylation domain-containing protein